MDESPLEARHTKAKDNKGMEGKGKSRAAGNNQLRKSPIDSFFDRDGEAGNTTGVCMHTRRVKYARSAEGAEEKHSNSVLVCRRSVEDRRRCTFAKLEKVSSLTRPYGFRWNCRDAGMRLLVLCLSR